MEIDGYTVSDVVMFWRDTPVVGVEDAELPQVSAVLLLRSCRSAPSSSSYIPRNVVVSILIANLFPSRPTTHPISYVTWLPTTAILISSMWNIRIL